MQTRPVRMLAGIAILGTTVLALTGCPEDASEITETKATSLDFDVAPIGGVAFPGGDLAVDQLLLVAFDTTVTDAFARADTANFGLDDEDGTWVFGVPGVRSTDPRLPLLTATSPFTAGSLVSEGPGSGRAELAAGNYYFWFISGAFGSLPPNTTFTVAFVRLATQVNGELDQSAFLQGDPITQPDSLFLLAPINPLGDPATVLGVGGATTNFNDTINAQAGANPYILGHASSDANGASDFGIIINCADASATPVFYCGTTTPVPSATLADSSMYGRNDDVNYVLPRYNYIVLYEGQVVPTDNTPQVARWQVGQDLQASGVVNNGAAPFPTAAFTNAQLIAAPGGAGRPDSVTFTVSQLLELAGGSVYQAWLYNRDESPPTMAPATAFYEEIAIIQELDPITGEVISERDSVLSTMTTSSFPGRSGVVTQSGGVTAVSRIKHVLSVSDASSGGGGSEPGFYTDIFLSVESAAGAAMPSGGNPVFFQYTDQNGTPTNFFDDVSTSGTAAYGTFDVADATASRIVTDADFTQTSGQGGIVLLADDGISVDIRNLPLPPVGYYYAGWATGVGILVPATAMPMGSITTIPPDTISLFNADVDQSTQGVTSTGILAANTAIILPAGSIITTSDSTVVLNSFFLTLTPKAGEPDQFPPTPIQVGAFPIATMQSRGR